MTLNDYINQRLNKLGKKRKALGEAGIGGQTEFNIVHNRFYNLSPGTKQKLAEVLECTIGDINEVLAQSPHPFREEVERHEGHKKTVKAAEEKPEEVVEEEPEELPFADEPEPEPEEGEDMKWFHDIPKEEVPETPKKVKVKKIEVTPEIEKQAEANPGTIQNEIPLMPAPWLDEKDANVNHPSHYTQGGIECIDAIRASMTAEEFKGFLKGNAVKYLWRYSLKNGVEDLKKASWYLNRLIKELAGE